MPREPRRAICKSRERHRRLGSREGLQPCATLRPFANFKAELGGDAIADHALPG